MYNMENISNISVILPVKTTLEKDFNDFFIKAIESLKNQVVKPKELIIVHTTENTLVDFLNNFDFTGLNVKKVSFDGEPNYSSQINLGVKNSECEWVSFFEFDDEYSRIWFKNFQKYSEIYPDVDAFLPLVVDVDNKSVFAGFTNEATFAANISSEIGMLTNETLQNFQNFQFSGCVFKKETFERFGGLKSNFKLTFNYELFLRLTQNSVKIMSVPRVGYKHMNLREGSIFWNYKNGQNKISEDEARFWIETAKKESFFNVDRDIKYEPQNV